MLASGCWFKRTSLRKHLSERCQRSEADSSWFAGPGWTKSAFKKSKPGYRSPRTPTGDRLGGGRETSFFHSLALLPSDNGRQPQRFLLLFGVKALFFG